MKKIILLICAGLLGFQLQAQTSLFDQLTEKYSNVDGFSASRITSDMFDLYLKKKNIDENSPVSQALKNLDKILVISQNNFTGATGVGIQNPKPGNSNNEVREIHEILLNHYKKNDYTLFKTEKRMGEDIKVYLKKNNENIEGLALLTNTPTSTNLVELQGKIDLNNVSELSKALNLRGLENLYKINNSTYFVGPSASPDAVFLSQPHMEEMEAMQRELQERQNNLSAEQRKKLENQTRLIEEKQRIMAEKYREMAEKYQRQPIFINPPGDTNTVYYINGKKVKAEEIKELDPENIQSIEVNKGEKSTDKSSIRIKTK